MQTLNGITAIITRPIHQTEALENKISQHGGKSILLPMLRIEKKTLASDMAPPQDNDIIIFLSANAVNFSAEYWQQQKISAPCLAIGPATERALLEKKIPCSQTPSQYNSEGLLTLPQLQQITGKTVYICCGENPRPLLPTTLKQRGADIIFVESYRRQPPDVDTHILQTLLQQPADIVILTSKESLLNWSKYLPATQYDQLRKIPLLVISTKMKALACSLNLQTNIIADNASDAAIIEALLNYYADVS